MKLKKAAQKGTQKDTKVIKKQQVKVKPEEKTHIDDQQQQRDDDLIDIKEDLKKKQEPKPKINKRIESNKLEQKQIDVSNIIIQQKSEEKKLPTTWVVNADQLDSVLKKDFVLDKVDHQFQSLTDSKINEQIQEKIKVMKKQRTPETVGHMIFAPLSGGNLADNKDTQKLVYGKPKTDTPSFGISLSPTPVLNFTNSNIKQETKVAQLQKASLNDDQIQKKMKERMQQRPKVEQDVNQAQKGKGMWFKKSQGVKQVKQVKQAPKMEFKSSPLTFTNSNLNNQQEQAEIKSQKLQKPKQQQMYERKQQQFKFVNKKQQEQRKKKRQEQQQLLQKKEQKVQKA